MGLSIKRHKTDEGKPTGFFTVPGAAGYHQRADAERVARQLARARGEDDTGKVEVEGADDESDTE